MCTSYFVLTLNSIWPPEVVFNLDFFLQSSLMGTTLRAAPSKSYAFSTNFHAWIALPASRRCALPILFWPWPPYNLLLRSCLTWIFFVDSHWWVPLCVQDQTIYMPFQQIIMYILQCPHDIHVRLFCFDLHKFLLRSRTATCPTLNCGRGTSLFRQELVYIWHLFVKGCSKLITVTVTCISYL